MNTRRCYELLVLFRLMLSTLAFITTTSTSTTTKAHGTRSTRTRYLSFISGGVSPLHMSSTAGGGNNDEDDDKNDDDSDNSSSSSMDMRRLLESSWNTKIMGDIPNEPKAAAKEAGASLINAMEYEDSNIFFIDLLLPSYDKFQGTNLYDEVLAVDFCVHLSNQLKNQQQQQPGGGGYDGGKACIVVRDGQTVRTVSRVLDAREKEIQQQQQLEQQQQTLEQLLNFGDEDDDKSEEEGTGSDVNQDKKAVRVDGNDDDDDNDDDDESSTTPNSIDDADDSLESFRKNLMLNWDDDDEGEDTKSDESKDIMAKQPKSEITTSSTTQTTTTTTRNYRLCSMFGDATISSGADMLNDVVQAVSANGQPNDDEDYIIILAAISNEEMIGVRALVGKYASKKKAIILVNSQFDPLPRELRTGQTVYSIMPLIARPKSLQEQDSKSSSSPKIVILRRYPKDWEIYIDPNDANSSGGFEFVDRAMASQVGKNGPPMDWIANCIQTFMRSR